MQTYQQTVSSAQTMRFEVPGKYFAILACTNALNVRFYNGGKQLDLGQINGVLAGLEVTLGNIGDDAPAFDRVEVDTTAADTITVGIGNGQARYNRGNASVQVTQNAPVRSASCSNLVPGTGSASSQLVAANASRSYLAIQNKDATLNIYIGFGAANVTTNNGLRIPPGAMYEMFGTVSTQAIQCIGDAATSNVVTVEG